jgi:hypothetical protein
MSARNSSLPRELARRVLPHVPLALRRNALYLRRTKRLIPRTPQSFLEKIQWRILHDRRDIIAHGGDKLAMKAQAERSNAGVIIPETIWHGEDLASIYDKDWGCDWVLKPITGSGFVAFGSGSMQESGIHLEEIKTWRHEDMHRVFGEWAYGQAAPGYLLEQKIDTPNGQSPNDYRFFVFDGQVKLVQIDTPRFSRVQRRFYTPDWTPLDVRQGHTDLAPAIPAPSSLQTMRAAASAIGREYDFIRVDLYDVEGRIYFGEITPYPAGGVAPFSDREFDLWLGGQWTLPALGTSK